MSHSLSLFVATRASDAPCRAYVSVDGTVPGCVLAWDHHVTGEPVNLDALPARIDLHEIARAHGLERIEGVATPLADADAVTSAVVVLLGGRAAVSPPVLAVLRSASHWCDHLVADPTATAGANAAGARLAEWIARELAAEPRAKFGPTVRTLETIVRRGDALPGADPDPAVDEALDRIRTECRLRVVYDVAVVDQRGLPPLPPARVAAMHDRPVTVTITARGELERVYIVGVSPHVRDGADLGPALRAVAAAEHTHGPPCLRAEPGPGSENWGGRASVFGSPWNYASRLEPDEVARLVSEAGRSGRHA